MAQLLRALSAFPQELGFISSTDVAVHNHLKLQFQGARHPLLVSSSTRCALSTQTYVQANCPWTLKRKQKRKQLKGREVWFGSCFQSISLCSCVAGPSYVVRIGWWGERVATNTCSWQRRWQAPGAREHLRRPAPYQPVSSS